MMGWGRGLQSVCRRRRTLFPLCGLRPLWTLGGSVRLSMKASTSASIIFAGAEGSGLVRV